MSFLSFVGNVYIADTGNHLIRKLLISSGVTIKIAGSGSGGYSGDNGKATSAGINYPTGVALELSGILHSTILSTS